MVPSRLVSAKSEVVYVSGCTAEGGVEEGLIGGVDDVVLVEVSGEVDIAEKFPAAD